jgi:uncharacterized membrane protein YdbT with pleckstrin-like domain
MLSTYVERSLVEGETVQARAHYHWLNWVLPVGAAVLPALFWALAFAVFDGQARGWLNWLWLALFALGLFYFLWEFIRIRSTEIAVTNRRFIRKTGWLARDTSEISLRNIEEVKLDQTIVGRILGYGTLTIRGTGGSTVESPNMDDPKIFQRALQTAMAAAQPPRDPAGPKQE